MSAKTEWRIVDRLGHEVDEGLDVAWVIYETRAKADERRRELDKDYPEGAPHELQRRDVTAWKYRVRGRAA